MGRSIFKREPLTAEESNRLANACIDGRERLITYGLLDMGLRVQELAKLTRHNVEWQLGRVIIHGKGGSNGSMSKRRIVPMTPRVKALLEAHFALHDTIGLGVRAIQRLVKTVATRAGIVRNVTPHVLRHTFAVTAIQKGISIPALQRVLGHERLSTTEIYLNLSPEDALAEFASKFGR